MAEVTESPRLFRYLAAFVMVFGVLLLAISWRAIPPALGWQLALVAIAAVLSENYALSLSKFTVSLAYPLTVAATVLAGPTAGALVAGMSAVSWSEIVSQKRASVLAFNLGQLPLVTVVGGWVYLGLGGRLLLSVDGGEPLGAGDFPQVLIPLTALALTCALGNIALTSLAISALRSEKLTVTFSSIAWLIPTQVALAYVGLLIGQVLSISIVAFPLFVAPLVIARQLYQRYSFLKASYADTVRSLIGALEAKDSYTRGHSERVAAYSLQIGSRLGLDTAQQERLEYAALLHDVGKLAVPSEILRKQGPLTEDERHKIREHASRGAEMVSRIPPLRDLAAFVGQHHERFSGGGYPEGIDDVGIHQFARILAVADSYDAMTTSRSYREAMEPDAALKELVSQSGSQFDPTIVAAFSSYRNEFDICLSTGGGRHGHIVSGPAVGGGA